MAKVTRRDVKAGSTALVIGQVVQVAIAFGTNIVLVRYIAPEGFGRFAITLATASLILSLVSIRVNSLIIRVPDGDLTLSLEERYFSYLTIETLVALVIGLAWVGLAGNPGALELSLVVFICLQHWINQNKSFFSNVGCPMSVSVLSKPDVRYSPTWRQCSSHWPARELPLCISAKRC